MLDDKRAMRRRRRRRRRRGRSAEEIGDEKEKGSLSKGMNGEGALEKGTNVKGVDGERQRG